MTGYFGYNAVMEKKFSTHGMAIAEARSAGKRYIAAAVMMAVMVLAGLLTLFMPATGKTLFVAATAMGLAAFGAVEAIYFSTKKSDDFNSVNVGSGVALAAFGVIAVLAAMINLDGLMNLLSVLAFVSGLYTVATGLDQFDAYKTMNRSKSSAEMVLVSAVMNLVLGVLLIAGITLGWNLFQGVWGMALILGGAGLMTASVIKFI